MNKLFLILFLSGILVSNFVLADVGKYQGQDIPGPGVGNLPSDVNITSTQNIINIILYALSWIYTIFFVIAVIMIILAAYRYLVHASEPDEISKAHKQLIWAAVAIAVALISLSIVKLVGNFVTEGVKNSGGGNNNINNSSPPTPPSPSTSPTPSGAF